VLVFSLFSSRIGVGGSGEGVIYVERRPWGLVVFAAVFVSAGSDPKTAITKTSNLPILLNINRENTRNI